MPETYQDVLNRWGLQVREEDLAVSFDAITPQKVQDFHECPHVADTDYNYAKLPLSERGHALLYWSICFLTHAGFSGPGAPQNESAFSKAFAAEYLRTQEILLQKDIECLSSQAFGEPLKLSDHILNMTPQTLTQVDRVSKELGVDLKEKVQKYRHGALKSNREVLAGFFKETLNLHPLGEGPTCFASFARLTPKLSELFEAFYPSIKALSGTRSVWDITLWPVTFFEMPLADFERWGFTLEHSPPVSDNMHLKPAQDDIPGSRLPSDLFSNYTPTGQLLDLFIKPVNTPEFDETLKVLACSQNFEQALKASEALTR